MSTVTINQAGIDRFFQTHSLAGQRAAGPELQAAARLMVEKAKQAAEGGVVQRRTGDLANSYKPIVRVDLVTGLTEVGVGSNLEYAKYIEEGTPEHKIENFRGTGRAEKHPGNRAYRIMRQAVDSVIPSRGF